ncbi:MAG: response regulator [Gemmatimonadetes bacterium]|nr:response regulator [Gemmatimonadota bacterium]MBT8405726.1 response regulator [Gemmatimonadota bacterium]NNK63563.1 response regulator [Gemmatimonadota bacterium]
MSTPRGWAEMARLQTKGARILVVEDEDAAREGMVRLLEGQGYEVRGAGSAEHADHWLSAASFDLALVDIGLPGMDGVEFLRWALRRNPMLAVIMTTGLDRTDIALECLKGGARGYLLKPIDPLFLMEAVRDALVLGRLLRAAPEGWEEGDATGA